jgi:hypothetical protein
MKRMRLEFALLRMAAWLAPSPLRGDWLAEWRAELCYGWQNGSPPPRQAAIVFCLGAFRDAAWLRRNTPAPARSLVKLESPVQCLGWLLLLAVASVVFGAWHGVLPRLAPDGSRLVMVSLAEQPAKPAGLSTCLKGRLSAFR